MKSIKKSQLRRRLRIAAISIVAILVVLVGGFYIYTLDYYRASDDVLPAMASENVSVQTNEKMIVISPKESQDQHTGLIFYPGGKIEAIAYIPLLRQLSAEGITCMLMKMPLNLAVFDINAADRVYDAYPHIDSWYIAGHSLGGAMASSYMDKHSNKVDGLILLGAYPINDADVATLVIYGSEDVRLDLSKLETTENKVRIEGGNHAYFGDYGEQEGDGVATISREDQQMITVTEIKRFIEKSTK